MLLLKLLKFLLQLAVLRLGLVLFEIFFKLFNFGQKVRVFLQSFLLNFLVLSRFLR